MVFGGFCEECGERVEVADAAYPVSGWEEARKMGGANRIIGREREAGRIAHAFCIKQKIDKAKLGDQMGLL